MAWLLLLLLTDTLCGLASTINPKLRNSSHEIYTISKSTNPSYIIYCSLPNCIIQCILQDSCKNLQINAINIHNVNIQCNSYDSCKNITLNANNQTKVNMNCLYAHSCVHSSIFAINSHIQLLCNREDSCQDIVIFINQPTQNAIDLSCNTEVSCDNLQIKLLNVLPNTHWTDSNWLNIIQFTNDFNIKLVCDENNNITLFYSTEFDQILCNTNMICCPLNYFGYNTTNATLFYSTTENIFTFISTAPELSDLFLFEYFTAYAVPLICISVIYTTLVSIWATIYFCSNTLSTYINYKSLTNNKSSMTAICEGSSFWNKCGYFMDGFNSITNIVLVISIFTHSSLSNNTNIWFIFGYLSLGAMVHGIMFYILKFLILNKFYPYILLWRVQRNKASKYKIIKHKNNKISLLLKHARLYDLFSASLSDSLQSFVILCICIDLNNGDFNKVLLHNNWNELGYFQWILRIKLCLCYIFMFYTLCNGVSVECLCHVERITANNTKMKDKSLHKYNIESETDNYDINNDIDYHSINDDTDGDYDSDSHNRKHQNGKIFNTKQKQNIKTNTNSHNTCETETFIEHKYNDIEMEKLNANNIQNNIESDDNEEDDDLKLSQINEMPIISVNVNDSVFDNISDNKAAQQLIKTVQNMSTFDNVKHGEHNYVENDIKEEEEQKINNPIDIVLINDNNYKQENSESINKSETNTHSDIIKKIVKRRPRRKSTGSKSQILNSKRIHQYHIISKSDHCIHTKMKLNQLNHENSESDKIIDIEEKVNNVEDDEVESTTQNTEIVHDSNHDSMKEFTPNSRTSSSESEYESDFTD